MNSFNIFVTQQKKIFKTILAGLAVLMVFRVIFMFRFGELETIKNHTDDFIKLFVNGLRFDLLSISYLLLPISVLSLSLAAFRGERYNRFVEKASLIYIPIAYSFICLAVIVEQQFYAYFKYRFNAVLFDFFHEKPLLLIKSMWQENHVVIIFLVIAGLVILISKSVKKLFTSTSSTNRNFPVLSQIGITILVIGLNFLFIRGSVTTFPLHFEDINVSDNEFINSCVPNSIYMLKIAYIETKNDFKTDDINKIPSSYGFNSIEDALSEFYRIPLDSIKKYPIEHWLFKEAQAPDSIQKPNVVVVLVESWSNHLINFQSDKMDLLSSMKKHLEQDVVYRNFQSSGNGTITSLENTILNVPYHPFFDSKYRFHPFESSIAYPFKQSGYETKFITGLEITWRHISEVLPIQYFDHTMGKYNILKSDPKAKSNTTWGVYDHHVMDFIYQQLKESKKPQFIFCLTSTSHTPFELPSNYPLPAINQTADIYKHFDTKPEITQDYLRGYQYSNKALGDFMDKIKSSELAKNTIVVFTGDHNIRSIFSYKENGPSHFRRSVPLYIYFPERIKKGLQIDTTKYGSHYDILTSIAPHILRGVKYFALGQDLFDGTKNKDQYFSINDAQTLHGNGMSDAEADSKNRAQRTIASYYFSKTFKEIEQKKQASSK